jgi:hypothetical protein
MHWIISLLYLTFRIPASYIKDGHTATFNTPHFLYFSTNTRTELFKHAAHSPFLSLQNAVYFTMLPFLVSVLFTFYIQGVLKKIKKIGWQKVNIQAPTCFGSSLPSSGSFLDPCELLEMQNKQVSVCSQLGSTTNRTTTLRHTDQINLHYTRMIHHLFVLHFK